MGRFGRTDFDGQELADRANAPWVDSGFKEEQPQPQAAGVFLYSFVPLSVSLYATRFMPGGCHVPSPGGKIEGASVFGQ